MLPSETRISKRFFCGHTTCRRLVDGEIWLNSQMEGIVQRISERRGSRRYFQGRDDSSHIWMTVISRFWSRDWEKWNIFIYLYKKITNYHHNNGDVWYSCRRYRGGKPYRMAISMGHHLMEYSMNSPRLWKILWQRLNSQHASLFRSYFAWWKNASNLYGGPSRVWWW